MNISLTKPDGEKILVEVEEITSCFTTNDGGTKVFLSNGREIVVKESVVEILKKVFPKG